MGMDEETMKKMQKEPIYEDYLDDDFKSQE